MKQREAKFRLMLIFDVLIRLELTYFVHVEYCRLDQIKWTQNILPFLLPLRGSFLSFCCPSPSSSSTTMDWFMLHISRPTSFAILRLQSVFTAMLLCKFSSEIHTICIYFYRIFKVCDPVHYVRRGRYKEQRQLQAAAADVI